MNKKALAIGLLILLALVVVLFVLFRSVFKNLNPFASVSPTPTYAPVITESPLVIVSPSTVTLTPIVTPTPVASITVTPTTATNNKNLVSTISSNSNIGLFSQGMYTAKLDGLLSKTDHYTVFAPIDSAINTYFNGKGGVPTDINTLNDVYKNHIVYGDYSPAQLASGMTLTTVNNTKLKTGGTSTTPTVDGAKVLNVTQTNNGYVYQVDSVLTP